MSIKGRVEAKKKLLDQEEQEKQREEEQRKQEAENLFTPVYEAFLEIEKEYGEEKGIKIDLWGFGCAISKTENSDVRISLNPRTPYFLSEPQISVTVSRSAEEFKSTLYKTPEEAIDIVIDWIAKNLE